MEVTVINNFIDRDICQRAIAEIQVNSHVVDWSETFYTFVARSRDIANTYSLCPNAHAEIMPKIKQFAAENFPSVQIFKSFVGKYDAGQQNLSVMHKDPAGLTIVLNLNDDFEGGGTYIEKCDQTFQPPVGSLVCFDAKDHHFGAPVLSGSTRYIITIWGNEFKTLA